MGGVLGKSHSLRRSGSESKLDAKMVEAMQRRALNGTSVKSFDSIILKFPKIDESLRKCKSIFEQFGKLNLHFTRHTRKIYNRTLGRASSTEIVINITLDSCN